MSPDLVIHNLAGVASGRGDLRGEASELVIRDGRIASIGDGNGSATADRIDARGAWAIPGLWDAMHGLYFGDHEPRYSAVGTLAAGVRFGQTAVVAVGPPPIPGWSGSPREDRELAILALRSWRFDRPVGIRVEASAVSAHPAWTPEDLSCLATAGARTLVLRGDEGAVPARLVAEARSAGLRVAVRVRGDLPTPTMAEALRVEPDLLLVDRDAISERWLRDLLATTNCPVGVSLETGPAAIIAAGRVAAEVAGGARRLFVGTGLPSARGVMPAGTALALSLLGAAGVDAGIAVAMVTGNVASGWGLEGGQLDVGQAADLALVGGQPSSMDLEGLWRSGAHTVLIGGGVAWQREGDG